MIVDATSGIARAIQVIDSTGMYITQGGFSSTDATFLNVLNVVDEYGNRIPVETIRGKLEKIRERSHSRLGESWSKLAQM